MILNISLLIVLVCSSYASWWGMGKSKDSSQIQASKPPSDMIRSLMGSLGYSDTHFPRIFRTPSSYNAIFDLPGFEPRDIHVSAADDTIHVEGHTWCPKAEASTSWMGEKYVSNTKDMCIERHVDAHVTLPKNMMEHGSIKAMLENGVLTVCVPLYKEEGKGIARRMVDVLTGAGKKAQESQESMYGRAKEAQESMYGRAKESQESMYGRAKEAQESVYGRAQDAYERARESMKGAGESVRETTSRGGEYISDSARDAREKMAEYGEEYVRKPVQYAGQYAAEKVRDSGQGVAERAEQARRYMEPKKTGYYQQEPQHSKGFYEKASEVIANAADNVIHPFRQHGQEYETQPMREEQQGSQFREEQQRAMPVRERQEL